MSTASPPPRSPRLSRPPSEAVKGDFLPFFADHMEAIPLYEALEARILDRIADVTVKGSKTQLSFYNRHLFACVSFAHVRKKKDCPPVYIVVTIGLNRRLDSPRIDVATEPCKGRWTHHLLISHMSELDEELMGWIQEAADFAAAKR